jgi:predicted phosphodiesterase
MNPAHETKILNRRAFLQDGTLLLLNAAAIGSFAADSPAPLVRIGLLTDMHYADKPAANNRYYREALGKLGECVTRFNELKPDFVVELGDFVDSANDAAGEIAYVKAMESEYAKFKGDRHFVLGNHCIFTLTKQQFRDHCAMKDEHYSFDRADFHFVILDACYKADGTPYGAKNNEWTDTEIPPAQREWLEGDLKATKKKTIVFVHQRLDVQNNYGVKSAPAVRKILEESGKVLAVFQGHSHKNDYKEINGLHYCTLAAMIEGSGETNNAYSMLSLFKDNSIRLEGFRQQKAYQFAAK